VSAVAVVNTSIEALAAPINQEHRACRESYGAALEHAVACGDLLREAQMKMQHGAWTGWVEENFEGSLRTAQEYIQIANLSHQDPTLLEEADSISGAFAFIERQAGGTQDLNLDHDQIVDAEVVPEPTYKLTLSQLTSLACKRWHRPPTEKEVLAWLKDSGLV
jgi:hypothetical protein